MQINVAVFLTVGAMRQSNEECLQGFQHEGVAGKWLKGGETPEEVHKEF